MDVERQGKQSFNYTPTNSLKERLLDFLGYYFGPIKLYLFSYPMPSFLSDNRKLRLKASGMLVTPRPEPYPVVDRIIYITQRQPSD